jgi:putative inorganic carbon (HCO3(-)) transporter
MDVSTMSERKVGGTPWSGGSVSTQLVGQAACLVVLVVAIWCGVRVDDVGGKGVFLVLAGLVGGLALLYTALTDFGLFLILIILIRPVLDLSKSDSSAGGVSGILATGLGGLLTLAGVIWYAGLVRDGLRIPLSLCGSALVALVGFSVLSVGVSPEPVVSALQVARMAGAVELFLLLEQWVRSPQQIRRILQTAYLSFVAPLAVGLFQLVSGGGREHGGYSRVVGTFGHPNTYGFVLDLIILMAIPMWRYAHRNEKIGLGILIVTSCLELVFTYSRGSWLAFAVAFLLIAILHDRRLLLIFPAVVGLIVVFVPSVLSRVSDLSQQSSVGGRPANSLSWRFIHWDEILAAAHGHSLLGVGPAVSDNLTLGGRPPHNDLIRTYVEVGIFGLIAYVAFLVGLIVIARRALRATAGGYGRAIAVGYSACVVAFILDSLGANLIRQFVTLLYLFTFAAVALALARPLGSERADASFGSRLQPDGLPRPSLG